MHPAYIQDEIKKAGYTQKALAREYGCSEMQVSQTIRDKWGSEPLMRFICEKINIDPYDVFPEYFNRMNRRPRNVA